MKPYVIIPNLNGTKYLAESLRSLEAQSLQHQIVVVDNASTDGSVELVRKKFPNVNLIINDKNLGFAGGVNTGIRYALDKGATYVILFNNDAVADKDWIKKLSRAADTHPEAGIVTGKFLRIDERHIDSTGDYYSIWAFSYPRGRDEIDDGQHNNAEWVFSGTGGASLYRAEMLKNVGIFDEEFFAYYEDVDLGFRAQLAGWKAWYEPAAVAYHHVGGTSSKMGDFARYHSIKNFFYLYTKNMPVRLWWKYLPLFLISAFLMLVNSVRHGAVGTHLRAVGRIIVTLPYIIKLRWQIQRQRRVSSEYIDSIIIHQIPPTQKSMLRIKGWFVKAR